MPADPAMSSNAGKNPKKGTQPSSRKEAPTQENPNQENAWHVRLKNKDTVYLREKHTQEPISVHYDANLRSNASRQAEISEGSNVARESPAKAKSNIATSPRAANTGSGKANLSPKPTGTKTGAKKTASGADSLQPTPAQGSPYTTTPDWKASNPKASQSSKTGKTAGFTQQKLVARSKASSDKPASSSKDSGKTSKTAPGSAPASVVGKKKAGDGGVPPAEGRGGGQDRPGGSGVPPQQGSSSASAWSMHPKRFISASAPSSVKSFDGVSLLSAYSEPPVRYILSKKARIYFDKKIFGGDWSDHTQIPLPVNGWPLYRRAKSLMLFPGQGGTFGFGNTFIDENQKPVEINGNEDLARKSKSLTKHFLFYGPSTEAVGTTGCVTCVGVYFEIEGQRCFCAHINAWHLGMVRTAPDHKTQVLESSDLEYDEIWQAIKSRFERHSEQYGWTADDYVRDSLWLACPSFYHVGHVIISALAAFLGLDYSQVRPRMVDAQGFAFVPGVYNSNGQTMGGIEHRNYNARDSAGNRINSFDKLPDQFDPFEYTQDDHALIDLQPWTYQAGMADPMDRWTWNKRDGLIFGVSDETPPISPAPPEA